MPVLAAEKGYALDLTVGGAYKIDFHDKIFEGDIAPVVPGCDCYVCKVRVRMYLSNFALVFFRRF